jgi:uncharacterized protein (TIGR02996 family)
LDHADAFLQDVVAHPHDDAPRLIYADWLSDQDEPATRARAELIRVQYALESLPAGDPRRAALEQRERDVLVAHPELWAAGLRELGVQSWKFRRGFVEAITINPAQLVEQADRIRALIPLRDLKLTTLTLSPGYSPPGHDWEKLLAVPLFSQLEALDLTDAHSLSDDVLRLLVASGRLQRLKRLTAHREAAAIIVGTENAPKLQTIRLDGWRDFPADDLAPIFHAASLTELKRLEIDATEETADALRGSPILDGLEELCLRGRLAEYVGRQFGRMRFSRLRRADLGQLGWAVRTLLPGYPLLPSLLTKVESLDVSSNGLRDGILATLLDGTFDNLRHLVLNGNPIGADGASTLAGSGLINALESLRLRTTRLGDAGLAAIVSGNPRWRELNASYNGIGPSGLRWLGQRWPEGLAVLDVSWNPCRDAGVIDLCASADFTCLEALDLSYCELANGAAEALAGAASLTRLQTLNLSTNRIGDVGLTALATSPHLRELRSLHLGNTAVTDAGAAALLGSPLLTKLEVLMLNGTQISDSLRQRLRKEYKGILG